MLPQRDSELRFMMGAFVFSGGYPLVFVQECAKIRKRRGWGRSGKWESAEAIENKETRVVDIWRRERGRSESVDFIEGGLDMVQVARRLVIRGMLLTTAQMINAWGARIYGTEERRG